MMISFLLSRNFLFLNTKDLELMAIVARLVWLRRNAIVFGSSISPLHSMVSNATESLLAFQSNSQLPSLVVVPSSGISDGKSFHLILSRSIGMQLNRIMGIGVKVRDIIGEVLASLSAPKNYIIDSTIVEAMVVLQAVYFCQELSFHKVSTWKFPSFAGFEYQMS